MRYLSIVFVFLFACNPPSLNKESQDIVKEELESRKIMKITEGEILSAAQSMGNTIAEASQKALLTELTTAIKERGVIDAIKYCNLQALPIVDSLGIHYHADIRRTSLNIRNTQNNPSQLEEEILDAYQYTYSNNQPINENVQQLENDMILYTKPIVIGNAGCLNCHGTPGKELLSENHDEIKKLYPNDKATGYSMGDLRGMWSIRLNKKEVIKSL